MIRVEIGADSVRSITSKGRQFRIAEGYAHTLDPRTGKPHLHPTRFEFFLNDNDPAPSPGSYLLAPASIYVDRSGRLSIAPKLVSAPK